MRGAVTWESVSPPSPPASSSSAEPSCHGTLVTITPGWNLLLHRLRDGDTLVVTRLNRLGRSVVHLVTLGAELRERGVGLRVLEQGIDTATAEGRAMFGMLSVLAELQRELFGFRNFANYRLRLLLHCGVSWHTHRTTRIRGRSPRSMA